MMLAGEQLVNDWMNERMSKKKNRIQCRAHSVSVAINAVATAAAANTSIMLLLAVIAILNNGW